jgi:hypothetical protein|tara:strand:- start:80 stop:520 length:441 start_codon:yes stop_codon:yes gene_type:complete
MIPKVVKAIKSIFVPPIEYRNFEDDIECAIDETIIECEEMDNDSSYVGVPAPEVLSNDPWFGDPVFSEESKDYMERETEFKKQEEENRQYWTNESENIHQEMYDLATKNGKTTVQLDPVGGSETFQEGPGGWMSGTGYQGQGLTDR